MNMNKSEETEVDVLSENPDDKKTNLYVNFLPESTTYEKFQSLFTAIGAIRSCILPKNYGTGKHMGFGFVDFMSHEDAEHAINVLNNFQLEDKCIKVSYASSNAECIKYTKLYVCGLPRGMVEHDLEELFCPYGKIINSRVIHDQNQMSAAPRGIGFIRFQYREQAERAIAALNGTVLKDTNTTITVKFANPSSNKQSQGMPKLTQDSMYGSAGHSYHHQPVEHFIGNPLLPYNNGNNNDSSNSNWCIFVYNLGPDIEENTLFQLFGTYGTISKIDILRNKGFGFVTMFNYDEAFTAIQALHGFKLGNRVLQVSFKSP